MSARRAFPALLALTLLLTITAVNAQQPSLQNYPTTETYYYSTLSFPTSLTYYVIVSNFTKGVSNSSATNTSTTHFVNYTYVVSYRVVKYTPGGQLTVNVTVENESAVNKGFNFTLVKPGSYNVTVEEDPFTLYFPYIFPKYLYNNSYTLSSPTTTLSLVFDGVANESILGVKYEVLKYFFSNDQASGVAYITFNGTVVYFNTTYNGFSVKFFLNSSQGTVTANVPASVKLPGNLFNRSYLYAIYEYSNYSDSLQSVGDEEVVYPFVFPNGIIGEATYQINTVAGSPLISTDFFTIHIGNYTELETSFYPFLLQKITWDSLNLTMVGRSNVTIFGVNYPGVYVYEGNHSVQNKTFLYKVVFNPSGVLIEQITEEVKNGSYTPVFEAKYLGDVFYNANETYPSFQTFTDTNLPFSVISPSTSLAVAIIVTVAISAILVLLHRRE